ncbi:hypothetical protein D3C81_2260130 [compost metagenome]
MRLADTFAIVRSQRPEGQRRDDGQAAQRQECMMQGIADSGAIRLRQITQVPGSDD